MSDKTRGPTLDRADIKRRLLQLRERSGKSQRALARDLGISNTHVSNIENQATDDLPGIMLLIAWVDACDGDVLIGIGSGLDLLGDVVPMLNNEDARLVAGLARLLVTEPPEVRRLLRRQFEAMTQERRDSTAPTTLPRSKSGEQSKG